MHLITINICQFYAVSRQLPVSHQHWYSVYLTMRIDDLKRLSRNFLCKDHCQDVYWGVLEKLGENVQKRFQRAYFLFLLYLNTYLTNFRHKLVTHGSPNYVCFVIFRIENVQRGQFHNKKQNLLLRRHVGAIFLFSTNPVMVGWFSSGNQYFCVQNKEYVNSIKRTKFQTRALKCCFFMRNGKAYG